MSVRTLQADFTNFFKLTLFGPAEEQENTLPPSLIWPLAEVGQALSYLAEKSGFPTAAGVATATSNHATLSPLASIKPDALDRWIDLFVGQMGLEAEPVQSTYAGAASYLSSAAPVLLQLPSNPPSPLSFHSPPIDEEIEEANAPRFVALLQGGSRWLHLLARDGSIQLVRSELLRDALWADTIDEQRQNIEEMLGKAGVTTAQRPRVQQAILQEVVGTTARQNGWLLRIPPGAHLWQQARQSGLLRISGRLIGGYFAQLLLTIGSWWVIGQSALSGHFEWGWMVGWALLLLTTIPFQAWVNLAQSELAIGLGILFKQRLLYGVLQLNPEEIRHQGAGQFLGRVLASDTVEQLGLASGFVALLALFQLVAAAVILAMGVGGWLHALLLLLWVGVTIGLSFLYLHRSYTWVDTYREMTNDLVERMVGHRTRLAQESRQQWHEMEDQMLQHYLHLQRKLDQIESQLKAVIPRGWMVIGIGGLLYTLLSAHPDPTKIVISLGGILLAYQALTTIILGVKSIVGARLAWREVRNLFHATTHEQGHHPRLANRETLHRLRADKWGNHQPGNERVAKDTPILTVRDVAYRYQPNGRPVLQSCNLEINNGERLLLEGPSGGGKSTLVGILAGLQRAESGLLLLHNVDQQTMGITTWREQVVAVPQFHENYILTGTLAFNLLMGRRWPPSPSGIADADRLCRELGLGELIDRMPAGMQQMVGESGWQLSHGERSRVYIARALLQKADLLILDESFAALDPENLERTLQSVLTRAQTLLVIAHP